MPKPLLLQKLIKSVRWIVFLGLLSPINACNDKHGDNEDDDEIGPAGQEIPKVDIKFYDAKPDLSADGSKVVFISGREDAIRAYRFETSSEKGARLVTEKKIGDQLEAAISPNGDFVAIVGADENGFTLYVSDFLALSSILNVTGEEKGEILSISYSPDSEYLAYTQRSTSDGLRKLFVVATTGGGAPGTPQNLSADDEDESGPVWVPTGTAGQYQIVTKLKNQSSVAQTVMSRTFTTGITGVVETSLADDLALGTSIPFAANSDGIYFTLLNGQNDSTRKPIGAVGEDSELKFSVVNVPTFLSKSGGSSAAVAKSPGTEVLSISASSNASVAAWTVREAYACQNIKKNRIDISYGSTLILQNIVNNTFTRLVPQPQAQEGKYSQRFELTDDVCDFFLDEAKEDEVALDTEMMFAKISQGSTLTDYSIAYVTYFSGDLEVRLLHVAADVPEFFAVSDNRESK